MAFNREPVTKIEWLLRKLRRDLKSNDYRLVGLYRFSRNPIVFDCFPTPQGKLALKECEQWWASRTEDSFKQFVIEKSLATKLKSTMTKSTGKAHDV